jgi:hypothetical protein
VTESWSISEVNHGSVPQSHSIAALFIRGIMPRSGTNFLADILTCHRDIVRSPGNLWEFVPFRFQAELDRYIDRVAGSKHAPRFHPRDFLPYLGEAWLRFLAPDLGPDQVAIYKEPSVDALESMFEMFPRSRIIFIVRDGKDIISSQLKADFSLPPFQWWNRHHWRRVLPDESFRIHCRAYRHAAETLIRFLESADATRHSERFIVVKYEDLVQTPGPSIDSILSWAGLPADGFDWEKFEQMPVRGSSFLRNRDGKHDFGAGVQKSGNTFQPIGRWRNWSERRLRYYRSVAGQVARQLGYPDASEQSHRVESRQ